MYPHNPPFPYLNISYKDGYYYTILGDRETNFTIINQIKQRYTQGENNDTEKLSDIGKDNSWSFDLPSYISEKLSPPNLELIPPTDIGNLNIDSLMERWYTGNSLVKKDYDFMLDTTLVDTATIVDSIFETRIKNIPAIVDLTFNDNVRHEIERYLRKRAKGYIQRLIGKADYYLPFFEETLDAYDLPHELKYLPIIESAINPVAVSRAGATGMWQFMPATGKLFDIEQNRYVDERRDPFKSTHAAAQLFSSLYKRYNDWTLVLAAYNCGSGNVNRAIKRSGGKTSYWEIWPYLPKETRSYVPRYIAAVYLMNYYELHNIVPEKFDMPLVTDTIQVSSTLHLSQVSSVLDIPIEQLRALNPQYRKDIIPAKSESYTLRLPLAKTLEFIELKDSIYGNDIKNSNYVIANYKQSSSAGDTKNRTKLVYNIKSGDNIGLIAQWYGVKSADIKAWNSIYSNKIIVGDKLDIYVPNAKIKTYASVNKLSFEKKQARYYNTKSIAKSTKPKITKDGKFVYYTVRSGDNFWDIAKKFKGVSYEEIIKINNFSKNTRINPGDLIRIKPI